MRVLVLAVASACANEVLRGGANMYHVKDLLGHESLNTLKHYAKLTIVNADLKVVFFGRTESAIFFGLP